MVTYDERHREGKGKAIAALLLGPVVGLVYFICSAFYRHCNSSSIGRQEGNDRHTGRGEKSCILWMEAHRGLSGGQEKEEKR